MSVGILLFINSADASTSVGELSASSPAPDVGYRIYTSLGGGYGTLLSGEDYRSLPNGEQFLGTLNFGRRTPRWEWDLGLGWSYAKRAGTSLSGEPLVIRIRAGRADLSARYRLPMGLQLGPIFASSFGTDTRFEPRIRDSVATFYFGGKAILDLPQLGPLPLQAWGEILTELSSPGRDGLSSMVGLRIGLPVSFKRNSDSVIVSSAAPEREIRITLDAKKIFFKTASAEIRPEVTATLQEVAQFLSADQNQTWDAIEISGHSDVRGPLQYNMDLSYNRAASVQKALNQGGLRNDRIHLLAFGPTLPLDPRNGPQAWERNRRVELVIRNVKNPEPILERLKPLSTKGKANAN